MSTQIKRLLAHMEAGAPITPLQALHDLGIYRLAARIFYLKEKGYEFTREIVVVKNRFGDDCRIARYKLIGRQVAK